MFRFSRFRSGNDTYIYTLPSTMALAQDTLNHPQMQRPSAPRTGAVEMAAMVYLYVLSASSMPDALSRCSGSRVHRTDNARAAVAVHATRPRLAFEGPHDSSVARWISIPPRLNAKYSLRHRVCRPRFSPPRLALSPPLPASQSRDSTTGFDGPDGPRCPSTQRMAP